MFYKLDAKQEPYKNIAMKQFFKVLFIVFLIVVVILLSVVLVDNVILPNMPAEFQQRWVYVVLSFLAIISLFDGVAGITGYTLRDLFIQNSGKYETNSNRESQESRKRDELYEQKFKDSLFNQNDKQE